MRSVSGWEILGRRTADAADVGWTATARSEALAQGVTEREVRACLRSGTVTSTRRSPPRAVYELDGVVVVLGAAGTVAILAAHRGA